MSVNVYPISPTQALETADVRNGVQIFQLGNKYYYVTLCEVGNVEATFNLFITRSLDAGQTWTVIVNADVHKIADGPGLYATCQRGTLIYIFMPDWSTGRPSVFSFDMATEALNTSYALGPTLPAGANMPQFVAVPLPDGVSTFLAWATFYSGAYRLVAITFDGAAWSGYSGFVFSGSTSVAASAYDASRIYIILQGPVPGPSCLTANINTLAFSTTAFLGSPSGGSWSSGFATVCNGELAVASTVSIGGVEAVHVFRGPAVDSGSMGPFTDDVVESITSFPPDYIFDGGETFPSWGYLTTICIGGLLHCFYMVSNGNYFDNATAQSYLYFKTSTTPGTWSARTLLYTTPLGKSLITPDVLVTSGGFVVLQNQINYSLFGGFATKFSSLSTVLLVDSSPPSVTCNNPPQGNVLAPYSHRVSASDGVPPYTFSISAGALPPGLVMDSTGLIAGVPLTAGTFSFTVQVTDSTGGTATVSCTIVIVAVKRSGGGLAWRFGPRYPRTEVEKR